MVPALASAVYLVLETFNLRKEVRSESSGVVLCCFGTQNNVCKRKEKEQREVQQRVDGSPDPVLLVFGLSLQKEEEIEEVRKTIECHTHFTRLCGRTSLLHYVHATTPLLQ